MNLRNAQNYNIGLDLGTGSVGWAVTDENGKLYSFKKKATWGSRIFPSALPASEARSHRSQRRRYERRRQRLELLQGFFEEEMAKVDAEFFIRLNQSRLLPEDRTRGGDYRWPLFNDPDFNEVDYYRSYPTIYHLRAHLCESSKKEDIRLIYLALHNIVKHRGNFLYQDNPSLSAQSVNLLEVIESLCSALQEWCEVSGALEASPDAKIIAEALRDTSTNRSGKQDVVCKALGISSAEDPAYAKALATGISKAIVGLTATFSQMFPTGASETFSFSLSKEDKVEEYLNGGCPDEALPLFEAMQATYSAFVLAGILRDSDGGTISVCKKKEYEKYAQDLALLKTLVRQYAPESYKSFFGGDYYSGTKLYDPEKSGAYTRYDLVHGASSYEELKKSVTKLLGSTDAPTDPRYMQMCKEFEEGSFLRRLKTSDNGSIPYQLHLEEMRLIIARQAPFFPFLEKHKKELESLVSFRIPYYVGPLTTKNAPKDRNGKYRFAWSERRPGMESERVYPWNWDEVIDKNKSAVNFMGRLTGMCTYLNGEPVLPKCSMLYEEFCVLNELNGSRWTLDGDEMRPFDFADRKGIVRDLFTKRRVSYKMVEDWMRRTHGHAHVHVLGGQGEKGYESRLSSYIFFCKDVFHSEEIAPEDYSMVEELILWNTLFEDRTILKEKIEEKYGNRLDESQIKAICRKRFTGWGRLSRRLLTGIKAKTDRGDVSIMDVLRNGSPNNGERLRSMVFMQVIHDDALGFERLIEDENRSRMGDTKSVLLEEMPGSPSLRRSVNQALRIVEEIVGVAGCAPANIFIEYTRDDEMEKKGRRTTKRYDALMGAVQAFKRDNPEFYDSDLLGDLKRQGKDSLDERLTLYFMQGGKCLYSDNSLEIEDLYNTSKYQVDHILPQSYVKDDSLENKALVLSGENQRKSDALLLDRTIRLRMGRRWRALKDAGLISEKKYNNLMRDRISDKQLKGFLARQLVETSQIVKFVTMFLAAKYPSTNVRPIKASLSSQLREVEGCVKCRDLNDYHHAHDALLACEIGRFITLCHPGIYEEPIRYAHAMREFIKNQRDKAYRGTRAPGNTPFVLGSLLNRHVDADTGEVVWDSTFELGQIKKYLSYKDCFVSRMPEETSGAFWKDTIYSPHGGKFTATISLKRDLPVEKYGGYSYAKDSFAYFSLYLAIDSKGKQKAVLTGIPIADAESMAKGITTIEKYAELDARRRKLTFSRILKSRLLKYSRFDLYGDQYYLPAVDAVYSSRQLVLSKTSTQMAALACDRKNEDETLSSEALTSLYDELLGKLDFLCSKFGNVAKAMKDGRGLFVNLSTSDKRTLIRNVLRFCKATTARVDLSLIGGPKNAGKIRSAVLTDSLGDVEFVDQSVTGMFERRTRLEL